ncbi:NUDIX domain-containing protein [Candidatus Woesearchaeota archaeon]|nr:NUDIX domain-containing protein [Candidatus Woesearchaeota archaeon]
MRTVNLIIRNEDGLYLVQRRDVFVPKFEPGKYPFLFPGACSLVGGGIEETDKTPVEGLEREVEEELGLEREGSEKLDRFTLPSRLDYRLYDFSKQLDDVFGRINEAYHGNLPAFLGFKLDELIPEEAAGKWRGKKLTYKDWLSGEDEYHLWVADISSDVSKKIRFEEGSRSPIWLPADSGNSLVMVPSDKLALLDEFVYAGYPKPKATK